MADLEARLRRLEDLQEIGQLFVDYGRHLDRGDFDSYAALFAEDGEVLLGPMGRAQGRTNIQKLMQDALGEHVGESVHVISSPQITLDGDRATAEVMWSVVHRTTDGTPALTAVGHHKDVLHREDGRWQFQRRAGYVDLPGAPRK
ncbi:MAG TPA: nuclear transport factor 2 family protein [Mycobacteriales bacterium]|nr:nuclear transport factor 2 family protein [Mycobacteriales bacterium]